ncbi:hypothetical protein GC173_04615 [bacterium]|nr:hypothetical protein [bacterium]
MKLTQIFATAVLVAAAATASAQSISLTNGAPIYTQDFNGLPSSGTPAWSNNSTLPAWYAVITGTNGTPTFTVSTGSGTAGSIYSYGAASDSERALGAQGSGNAASGGAQAFGVQLQNNGSTAIDSLTVTYRGEQWRDGGSGTPAAQDVPVFYQVSSSAISAVSAGGGTTSAPTAPVAPWEAAPSTLTFTSPVFAAASGVALDGNAAPNFTNGITGVITPTTPIAPGSYIVIMWWRTNSTGNDHGLAIDDLNVTANFATASAVEDWSLMY